MVRRTALALGAAAVAVALVGCGGGLVLKHSPLTAAASSIGTVALSVNNNRAKDEGGENPMIVGRVRNMYGMPIKKEADNSVPEALKALNADALASAGYKVADGVEPVVVFDLTRFFMDGYMGYKLEAIADIKVMKAGAEVFKKQINVTHGFAYKTSGSMITAYDEFMNMIAKEVAGVYSSAEFQAAAK